MLLAAPAVAIAQEATLNAPASVQAGGRVQVDFTGPHGSYDAIYIVPVGAPDNVLNRGNSTYANGNSPARVRAPEDVGSFEIRYLHEKSGKILARRGIVTTPISATMQAPATAAPGSVVKVTWTGPANYDDRMVVVPEGTPENTQNQGITWIHASPSGVTMPGIPGQYEIRYLTAQKLKLTTLARAKITVLDTRATLQVRPQVVAGAIFQVVWTGPGNGYDRIVIARKDAPDHQWEKSTFATARSPMSLHAPATAGAYELRYLLNSRGDEVLARADLNVTPAQQEPGRIRVSAGPRSAAAGGAVEIILDTSGSMLQRLGSRRRIEITKATLGKLTSGVIPAGTPFALRVFGRGNDSRETELDIPLQPLDARAASGRIAALKAKNNAKTPTAASLAMVATDLASVRGERLVVLVTDGEETCNGDPLREIEALREQGVDVRVNIVGFALEDQSLAASFEQWSSAGNGAYFGARDAAGLNRALTQALAPAYDVVDASDHVIASGVVGGDPVSVSPGDYTVRQRGEGGRRANVQVRAKETSSVGL